MSSFTTFKIGWRNIWRNPRRSVLTLLAIGFAAAVLVFFVAIQLSSYSTSINATVGVFTGHLQVQREGYLKKPQMRKTILHTKRILGKIDTTSGVKAAGVRASAFSLVSSEERTYGCQIVGVDPERERGISSVPGVIKEGRFLSRENENEAVVGSILARNLKLSLGDELTLLGQGRDGSLAAAVIPVVGFFETGSSDFDRSTIEIPLGTFRDIYALGPEEAHSVVVRAAMLDAVPLLKRRIKQAIAEEKNAVALDWEELLPGLRQSIDLDMASGWIFYLSLILVVTFSILNTFLMSVLERTREFGVMLALGMRPAGISGLILFECMLLTLVGISLGILVGGGIVVYFGYTGFSIPGTEEIMAQWNLPSAIYPKLSLASVSVGPGVILAASLLATLYPALRVFRIRPTEGMRPV